MKDTRAIIDAIIDGSIDKANTDKIPVMNLEFPTSLPNVSEHILDPRDTYEKNSDWEKKAKDLAKKYIKYFEQFADNDEARELISSGPVLSEVHQD